MTFGARTKAGLALEVNPVIPVDAFGLRRDLPHDELVGALHQLPWWHVLLLSHVMPCPPCHGIGVAGSPDANP